MRLKRLIYWTERTVTAATTAGLLLALASVSTAQDGGITLTQTAEVDIGYNCPATAAFDPSGGRLWILMQTCSGTYFSLLAFDAPDWTPVAVAAGDFRAALDVMGDDMVNSLANAAAFTPDGLFDIRYLDFDSFTSMQLGVNVETGEAASSADAVVLDAAALSAQIPGFAGYPEYAIYNSDHTLAAVQDDLAWYIIDLTTGELLFDVRSDVGSYAAIPTFSSDGSFVYMGEFNNPDDMSDMSAILVPYSLPDGERGTGVPVPSAFIWVSPDNQRAVAWVGSESDQIAVVDLTSGAVSEPLDIFEPPHPATTCANREVDLTDVNFVVSGELYLTSVNWLPDSSGFVTTNSYLGESGGSDCALNYSRLREYAVSSN